ncbi:hypothetical protein AV530_017356 [Patagioenas fasciata monilis]|uniref:Uncharacterized protein n=1 Tax=Patagioenas fasciata monilis TaxID=372326 RepID=A0A1V4JFS1_PATFA|nr:hypothetical protein AV530_017356 [Patagioenas fasciata monilis]
MPPARRGAAGGRGGQAGQLCRRTPPSEDRGWRRPLLSPTVRSPGAAGTDNAIEWTSMWNSLQLSSRWFFGRDDGCFEISVVSFY